MTDEEIIGRLLELQQATKNNALWKTFRAVNKTINTAVLESVGRSKRKKKK